MGEKDEARVASLVPTRLDLPMKFSYLLQQGHLFQPCSPGRVGGSRSKSHRPSLFRKQKAWKNKKINKSDNNLVNSVSLENTA